MCEVPYCYQFVKCLLDSIILAIKYKHLKEQPCNFGTSGSRIITASYHDIMEQSQNIQHYQWSPHLLSSLQQLFITLVEQAQASIQFYFSIWLARPHSKKARSFAGGLVWANARLRCATVHALDRVAFMLLLGQRRLCCVSYNVNSLAKLESWIRRSNCALQINTPGSAVNRKNVGKCIRSAAPLGDLPITI